MTTSRQAWTWAGGAALTALCALCGTLAAVNPVAAAGGAAALLLVAVASVYAGALPGAFLRCLGAALVGYALFNKGFAYLGRSPVFVGELVLGLGLAALVASGGRGVPAPSAAFFAICFFMAWGAARTLPYVGAYGVDALRDGVVWGYALFAVAVAVCLRNTRWLERVPGQYGRWVLPFVLWVPVAWAASLFVKDGIPLVPGSDTPVLAFKSGDAAVHLAGAAAFVLLGLAGPARNAARPGGAAWARPGVPFWVAWLASFAMVASFSRGGLLSIVVGLACVVVLGERAARARVTRMGVAALSFGALALALDAAGMRVAIRPPGEARALSVDQLANNLASVVGRGRKEGLEGSRAWRLEWWGKIVGYTVHGPYFWTGKGFGINLAVNDGFQTSADGALRSPHNGNLSILARAGVPGLGLWAFLNLALAAQLLRTHLSARRRGDEWVARMAVWLLAYWSASLVNMTFDVYLEGPQGGIWFWTVVGTALAVIDEDRRRSDARFGAAPRRLTLGAAR